MHISFKMLALRVNIHFIPLDVESGSVHIKLYLGKHEAYNNKDLTICDLWSHPGFTFFSFLVILLTFKTTEQRAVY